MLSNIMKKTLDVFLIWNLAKLLEQTETLNKIRINIGYLSDFI